MPRYYFNVYDGQDIFDRVGIELPSARDARQHMLAVAMEHIETFKDQTETWQMEALDEAGKIVGMMDFGIEDHRGRQG